SDTGYDVLAGLLKPFPPRTQPKVKLTIGGATVDLDGTVIPPGAGVVLAAEAAIRVKEAGQSSSDLAIEGEDDSNATRGIISLEGLGPALSPLTSNCPSR